MTSAVAVHNGTPTPFIDGSPVFAGYMWVRVPEADSFENAPDARLYAESGIHLYAFDLGREWCGPGAGHSGHYDFTHVEARLRRLLDVDPEARFHLRLGFEINRFYQWWYDLYPEEREIDSEGNRLTQSFASTVWRAQVKDFLRAFIGHLQDIGLDDRVFAYQTGAGHTGNSNLKSGVLYGGGYLSGFDIQLVT